jgi:hypothetical protein
MPARHFDATDIDFRIQKALPNGLDETLRKRIFSLNAFRHYRDVLSGENCSFRHEDKIIGFTNQASASIRRLGQLLSMLGPLFLSLSDSDLDAYVRRMEQLIFNDSQWELRAIDLLDIMVNAHQSINKKPLGLDDIFSLIASMELSLFEELAWNERVDYTTAKKMRFYLADLPGYTERFCNSGEAKTQHGYLTMQINHLFNDVYN